MYFVLFLEGGCNPLFFSCSYIDLAHFLITSTTREFRKKYLDAVLSAYVNQLDDILESQGGDSIDI